MLSSKYNDDDDNSSNEFRIFFWEFQKIINLIKLSILFLCNIFCFFELLDPFQDTVSIL